MQQQPFQSVFNNKIDQLELTAQSITLISGPLIVIGEGPLPKIVTGITDIIHTVNMNTAQTDATIKGLTNPK